MKRVTSSNILGTSIFAGAFFYCRFEYFACSGRSDSSDDNNGIQSMKTRLSGGPKALILP